MKLDNMIEILWNHPHMIFKNLSSASLNVKMHIRKEKLAGIKSKSILKEWLAVWLFKEIRKFQIKLIFLFSLFQFPSHYETINIHWPTYFHLFDAFKKFKPYKNNLKKKQFNFYY